MLEVVLLFAANFPNEKLFRRSCSELVMLYLGIAILRTTLPRIFKHQSSCQLHRVIDVPFCFPFTAAFTRIRTSVMKSNNLTSIVTTKNLFDVSTCQAFSNALTTSDVLSIFSLLVIRNRYPRKYRQ